MGPLLGRFEFDLDGRTAYVYSLVVLFAAVPRRAAHRAFAVRLRAEGDPRQPAARRRRSASSVNARLAVVYTLAAALAGAAGALLAQTTGFASLDVFDFHRSRRRDAGAGDRRHRLPVRRHASARSCSSCCTTLLSAWTPQYWQFWLGLILVRAGAGRPRRGRAGARRSDAGWRAAAQRREGERA